MRRSYETYGSPKWETHISHDQYHYPTLNNNIYFPQPEPQTAYYNNNNWYYPHEPPQVVSYQEEIIVTEVPHHVRHINHPKCLTKEPAKHVRFVEKEKVMEMNPDGVRKEVEVEESIDMEANKFIQQRHKNFAKWNTFNM